MALKSGNGTYTSSQIAYETIRAFIVGGKVFGGDPLREDHLTKLCDVSRTPVREALQRLAAEGWVTIEPNIGARVATVTHEELEERLETRAFSEGLLARRAADRISADQIQQLETLVEQMEAASQIKSDIFRNGFADLFGKFSDIIMAAAGGTTIGKLRALTVPLPVSIRATPMMTEDEIGWCLMQHRQLLEAFRQKDGAWAEVTMRSHIHTIHHVQLRSIGRNMPAPRAKKERKK